MKKCLLSYLLLLSSCAAWESMDINLAKAKRVNPLMLEASTELLFLRQDIIRQTYEDCVNDSTTETRKVDYHPMGFDLGNGLFYDFNRNLSLRLDYFLGIQHLEQFKIKSTSNLIWGGDISFKSRDSTDICNEWTNIFGNQRQRCLTVKSHSDTIQVFEGDRLCYSIYQNEEQAAYLNRRGRVLKQLEKKEDGLYVEKFRHRNNTFKLAADGVHLDNGYIISLNGKEQLIEIWRRSWGRKHLLKRVMFSEDEIIIFNRNHFGSRIIKNDKGLEIYTNKLKTSQMELL